MIALRGIDHVALRVVDLEEAAARWALQFALTDRGREEGRALLACDDEPCSLELVAGGGDPGHDHTGWELRRGCSLDDAAHHLGALGVPFEERPGALVLADPDGHAVELLPHRPPASPWVAHARPTSTLPAGHPRGLGHVNFLTGRLAEAVAFYVDVLGMRVTDWLGDGGVWLHVNADHHVMALIDKGEARFHHLAFDVTDMGGMRVALDHLGRHGRWLGWGPTRHGVGGNVASYVRIVEEPCFVELYCDMERLEPDHEPRRWPDDRFSSNTWGPLPPRSYFRFDAAAVESERESREALGVPLPEAERR